MEATASELLDLRRRRRHPRRTQFDYLHLRYLLEGIERALRKVPPDAHDVLDVWCGTRPYEDLLPAGARCIGLDRIDPYGVADVVSDEFLPFADRSFDLVLCTEAFYYVADLDKAVAELRRVLRPGGAVVISVSLLWEYNRTILERRYTGPELAALFADWDGVEVTENGGRAVCWAWLNGRVLNAVQEHLPRGVRTLARPFFAVAYFFINVAGAMLDRAERRYAPHPFVLPMNVLLFARRPSDA